jgi:hypothetical protein
MVHHNNPCPLCTTTDTTANSMGVLVDHNNTTKVYKKTQACQAMRQDFVKMRGRAPEMSNWLT